MPRAKALGNYVCVMCVCIYVCMYVYVYTTVCMSDLRLDNRRGWVRGWASHVLALQVNTPSLVVLPSQILHSTMYVCMYVCMYNNICFSYIMDNIM